MMHVSPALLLQHGSRQGFAPASLQERQINPRVWVQVVLSGDFHQLPPVRQGAQAMQERRFCFESAAWRACRFHCLQLTHVFRQVCQLHSMNSCN